MKNLLSLFILGAAVSLMLLSGCIKDSCTQTLTYYQYEPIYMTWDELREPVSSAASRELKAPGKMYFIGTKILISEVNKGIHVIENADPSNPQNLGFINIPGNHDLAVKGNMLYADSYTDLVTIDISDPLNVSQLDRDEDVFPYGMHHPGLWADEALGVAIDWEETEIVDEFDCGTSGGTINSWGRNSFFAEDAMFLSAAASNSDLSQGSTNAPQLSASPNGVGGSLARFTLIGDYMYAVTNTDLLSINIANPANPDIGNQIGIGWDIETIFPMVDQLFIGTMSGLLIYSIDNPAQPEFLSNFQHARSCDPVVVEGDFAYVTLRGGTPCGGFTNQLDVINISNVTAPRLVRSYSMTSPYGLGIRDGILFVCEGESGLKVYDASDVNEISSNQLAHFEDIHAFDVIPLTNILLMIGEGGLYQYDYSNLDDIREISLIPVVKE